MQSCILKTDPVHLSPTSQGQVASLNSRNPYYDSYFQGNLLLFSPTYVRCIEISSRKKDLHTFHFVHTLFIDPLFLVTNFQPLPFNQFSQFLSQSLFCNMFLLFYLISFLIFSTPYQTHTMLFEYIPYLQCISHQIRCELLLSRCK